MFAAFDTSMPLPTSHLQASMYLAESDTALFICHVLYMKTLLEAELKRVSLYYLDRRSRFERMSMRRVWIALS
jgi:hypothetical protein